MSRKLTTEEFIKRAREVHGDKYDYLKIVYKAAHNKIEIICPIHGVFFQEPASHLAGRDCPKCGLQKISKTGSVFKIIGYIGNDFYNA